MDVAASIEGDVVAFWSLTHRAADGGSAEEFASGTGVFPETGLATFDPRLLLNSLYDIVLTARDGSGGSASRKVSVVVEGQQKMGNFTLSLSDLAIALSSLPFRTSRRRFLGNFRRRNQ